MDRIEQSEPPGGSDVAYVLLGAGSIGLRAALVTGRIGLRAALASAQLARRLPIADALAVGLADEGRRAQLRAQAEARRATAALARSRVVDRLAQEVLDSELVVDLADQILSSPEMQRAIERIASSPELRSAIAEQSAGMAKEMVGGVRRTSAALDDASEQTVRRWLRRPQPRSA